MQEIIDYFANLLIIQYNSKPKARATASLLVKELLASGLTFDVRDGYNIDTTVGVQLDIIGKYVGVDRFYVNSFLDEDYFGFAFLNDIPSTPSNIIGFDDLSAPDKAGLFLDLNKIVGTDLVLNDDAYRVLIKLKIVQNASNHSVQDITESLFRFFGLTLIVQDNEDMTMSYLVQDPSDTIIRVAIQKNVLPRPMGVRLQGILGTDFFGFADLSHLGAIAEYIQGFEDYSEVYTETPLNFPLFGENLFTGGAWVNPQNITQDAGVASNTQAVALTDFIFARDFDFNVPANATITGAEVQIRVSDASSSLNITLEEMGFDDGDFGVIFAPNFISSPVSISAGFNTYTFGGNGNLLSFPWTILLANSPAVRIRTRFSNPSGGLIEVQWVKLKLFYELPLKDGKFLNLNTDIFS